MSSAHTSGPWLVATSNSWRRIVNHFSRTVCAPCTQPDGHPDLTFPNGGAEGPDARLIVAAPDLLEALQSLTTAVDYEAYGKALSKARAAIAKATGEPQ